MRPTSQFSPASRNFRLFLFSQGMSLLGNSVQQVALVWLVYQSSHSARILGLMGFASGIPAAIISPFAGVAADRTDPHRILIGAQFVFAAQALLLAGLFYFHQVNAVAILALVLLSGIINGVDVPMRQMFVARLVSRKADLGSAVAFNSIVYDVARIVGPAVGGLLLARLAGGTIFVGNAVNHLAVVALLSCLQLPSQVSRPERRDIVETFVEGVRYAFQHTTVRAILLLSGAVSFAGAAYMVLTPVIAADVLKGGPSILGILLSAVGVGAIAGGLFLTFRRRNDRLAQFACGGAGLFGLALLLFSQSREPFVAALALAAAGFGIMVMMASCNTILLTLVDADKHGRVLSLFTLSYLAMAPIGALVTGLVSSRWAAPVIIAGSAIVCVTAATAFLPQIASAEKLIAAEHDRTPETLPAAHPPLEL